MGANKYKKEFCHILPSLFDNGESVAEVCVELGIKRRTTFYAWLEKYPEFAEAYEEGKLRSEAWWCKLGRDGAAYKKAVQPALWMINMKNRFGWSDRPAEVDGDGVLKAQAVEVIIKDARKNK